VQAAAAAKVQEKAARVGVPSAPKIQLKMDFSAFKS
jgi:hypothetical protein